MKQDRIYKFLEFLKENIHQTPENYVDTALQKLKNRINKMFSVEKASDNGQEVERYGEVADKDKKEKGGMSFKDLGLEMQSLELSKYSKVYDNLKLIYSDETARYDLTITIDLKDAVPTDQDKDFSDKDIKDCSIKFKKYDQDNFEMLGEINKTVKIEDIDEEFLINLKLELDEEYGDDEEFEIET